MPSIVIPAHNEERTLGRLLDRLLEGAFEREFDVLVVANGCTDGTAAVAAARGPAVRVVETPVPSKHEALRLGDRHARGFPRVYVDADVELGAADVRALAAALTGPGAVLAAAPERELPMTGCSWPVRAYYRVWQRLPAVREGLFGRGVIAMTAEGHARIAALPPLMADDLAASLAFTPTERAVVPTARVTVHPPRTWPDLIRRRIRAATSTAQLEERAVGLGRAEGPGTAPGAGPAESGAPPDACLPEPGAAPGARGSGGRPAGAGRPDARQESGGASGAGLLEGSAETAAGPGGPGHGTGPGPGEGRQAGAGRPDARQERGAASGARSREPRAAPAAPGPASGPRPGPPGPVPGVRPGEPGPVSGARSASGPGSGTAPGPAAGARPEAPGPVPSARTGLGDLGALLRADPALLPAMLVFLFAALAARRGARKAIRARDFDTWLRDESSRQG
ncbi:glycosyltransferase [Streptomyces sp. NPDC015232]|uniref:glycosyltransferase n=1 Tax=unclassified Streptomyces TaxID=2593676 RepID=UPI0036F5BB92